MFTTRLGIVPTELLGGLQEDSSELVSRLVVAIVRAQYGYAVRDLLTAWGGKLSSDQMGSLIPVLESSGLDRQTLPEPLFHELHTAINEASRRLGDHSVLT
ncbi:hypothetical protein OUQ99_13015 [Streptomonospora nanhaiensis]|uniref:Uncharacterized protein n=1 Tax=Streptomonospora nanhaiensis TaxID=1323731 RepID=A0ABY6YUR1_9ACTN|nr:hypothetical protein [Streptomonospora nanhaiensis]WAE75933.1 hypothetical protein OUQ99_13015 [Streptomonospora nanhaiensis]